MKKLRLIAAIFALILLAGCVHLGTGVKEKLTADEVLEMYKLLDEAEYPREYEFGVFDCSNASALLYDYFTRKGFRCEVMVGWQPTWDWHSWLIVVKNGKEFWIESTTKQIRNPCCYEDYVLKFRFRSLKFLRFFSKFLFMPNEWDY